MKNKNCDKRYVLGLGIQARMEELSVDQSWESLGTAKGNEKLEELLAEFCEQVSWWLDLNGVKHYGCLEPEPCDRVRCKGCADEEE